MKLRIAAFCLLIPASCLFGAIEGTVINGTTGKPQPSVTISLVQPGANGMQAIATSTSDANGKFSIDHDLPPPPALLQADYKGVTYTQVQPPGRPTTGIQFQIYESATKPPKGMQMAHLIMIEPSLSSLEISETFLIRNESTTTFEDSSKGAAQFYPPTTAGDTVQVSVTPPTQMTIQRQARKGRQARLVQDRLSGAARRDALRHALHAACLRHLLRQGRPGEIVPPPW